MSMRVSVFCLTLAFVAACAGGCSCVSMRQLHRDDVERALIGPSIDAAVVGQGALGEDVAWAGTSRGADDSGNWVFDYVECPASCRAPKADGPNAYTSNAYWGWRTEFVDPVVMKQTNRRFAVQLKGTDVRELPEYWVVPRPGRQYVIYGRLKSVDPHPLLEIPRGTERILDLEVTPRLPDLARFDPVVGYGEGLMAARRTGKPVVVFLPESSESAQSDVAHYLDAAFDGGTNQNVVIAIDDSPRTWSRFRNVFHMKWPRGGVPHVVVDSKGSRRAEIAGLDDPRALRVALRRVAGTEPRRWNSALGGASNGKPLSPGGNPVPKTSAVLLLVALLAACAQDASPPGPTPAPGTGDYGGVQRADLIGDHVCRATGASGATFRWTFTETRFTIVEEGGPIAPEVLTAIAGRQGDVARIEGAWALDGGKLRLTDVHVLASHGSPTGPEVVLEPFKTPVLRVEIGGVQYVLGPAR